MTPTLSPTELSYFRTGANMNTLARNLDIDSLVLSRGNHAPNSDNQMCILEAVAFVAGEPWTDSPQCASPVIAAFLRSYNDSVSYNVRQSLKQYIPRLVGTRGSDKLEERRSLIAADWLVRTHTPAWLRLAGLTVQAEALESLPEITSMAQIPSIKGPIEAVRESADAAWDADWDAARAAAWDAARAAAGAAAWDAAGAAARAAAWDTAGAAARAAAWDTAGAAAWDATWATAGAAAWAAAGAAARAAARAAAWDTAGAAAWAAAGAAARAAAGATAGADAGATAGADAGAAAWDAARDALKPTVEKLQATIPELIDRMLSATEAK